MIAYYFRVLVDDKPNGYMGLVFGHNMNSLFFAIDEFCDPYGVEIKKAHHGGYCKFVEHTYYPETAEHGEEDVYDESEYEFAEEEPEIDDNEKWKKPVWPSFEVLYAR